MKIAYTLTPDLRIKLKEPFGNLIEGNTNETMAKVKEKIRKEKPSIIISVGDIVSRNLHSFSIHPEISIIDNISLRNQKEESIEPHGERIIKIKNPAGTITTEAIEAIKKAIATKNHTHIIVDGEEDLLTLVSVLHAPENALVVYGQPYCGIVMVKVTTEKKAAVRQFLKDMKTTKS